MTSSTRLLLDNVDLQGFLKLASLYGQQQFGYVVTPNVDHLIRLEEDHAFRVAYSNASFVLLDSQVLSRLFLLTRGLRAKVCTGSDVTAELLSRVATRQDRIVLIGATDEQVQVLRSNFGLSDLRHFNPRMGFAQNAAAMEEVLQFVEAHSPFRFCLLAVGSPQQERIAHKLHERGLARGLALCIGASIDFITGKEQRAPNWMRTAGLEWFYRLQQQPRRLARRYLIRGPRVLGVLRHMDIQVRLPAGDGSRATLNSLMISSCLQSDQE